MGSVENFWAEIRTVGERVQEPVSLAGGFIVLQAGDHDGGLELLIDRGDFIYYARRPEDICYALRPWDERPINAEISGTSPDGWVRAGLVVWRIDRSEELLDRAKLARHAGMSQIRSLIVDAAKTLGESEPLSFVDEDHIVRNWGPGLHGYQALIEPFLSKLVPVELRDEYGERAYRLPDGSGITFCGTFVSRATERADFPLFSYSPDPCS
jgi:hypothetical protein